MRNIKYAVLAIIMFASIASRGESYTDSRGITTHGLTRGQAETMYNTEHAFDNVSSRSSGNSGSSGGGCYVATAVYGSYDCPQVWTLRRYRERKRGKTGTLPAQPSGSDQEPATHMQRSVRQDVKTQSYRIHFT